MEMIESSHNVPFLKSRKNGFSTHRHPKFTQIPNSYERFTRANMLVIVFTMVSLIVSATAPGENPMPFRLLAFLTFLVSCLTPIGHSQEPVSPPSLNEWLVLGPVGGGGRIPLSSDSLFLRYQLDRKSKRPQEGETLRYANGRSVRWTRMRTNEKGFLTGKALRSAYCYTRIDTTVPSSWIVEGKGFASFNLNGDFFPGNMYGYNNYRVPIHLPAGENHLLVRAVRGKFSMQWVAPRGPLDFNDRDATLPDIRRGQRLDSWGSFPVLNTTPETLRGASLEVGDGKIFETIRTPLPPLAPLAILESPFRIRMLEGASIPEETTSLPLSVRLILGDKVVQTTFDIPIRQGTDVYRETFLSEIDHSVQYFAVRPPIGYDPNRPYALVLSLHGASVKASLQARSYSPKRWAIVVAATNRRRFGFDWEDWGRQDGLEVFDAVKSRYKIDPDRVYLVGHSMGGHGTWHMGVNVPGPFAGIGPSAGWISFWDYTKSTLQSDTALGQIFKRAAGASDTLALVENLKKTPIFIIHGDADDNVPVHHSRFMVQTLSRFHRDFEYHEEKGAGHWWDKKYAAGTDCVDLPRLFRFFQRHRRPAPAEVVDFRTATLSVSHRYQWIDLLDQEKIHQISRIRASVLPQPGHFKFRTENLRRFRFRPEAHTEPATLELDVDEQTLSVPWTQGSVELVREGKTWSVGSPVTGKAKRPRRYGPFKQAFGNRFVLVYGTGGNEKINTELLSRARYDASTWWYRGNGRGLLVADTDFDPKTYAGRNWILYGNEATNSVWKSLASDFTLSVAPNKIVVGEHTYEGPGFSCLALQPHPTNPDTLIGLIGATGHRGIRLTLPLRTFVSGVGYPDLLIWNIAAIQKGVEHVKLAGFFDRSWGLEKADLIEGGSPPKKVGDLPEKQGSPDDPKSPPTPK